MSCYSDATLQEKRATDDPRAFTGHSDKYLDSAYGRLATIEARNDGAYSDVPDLVRIVRGYIEELTFHGRQIKLAQIAAILNGEA